MTDLAHALDVHPTTATRLLDPAAALAGVRSRNAFAEAAASRPTRSSSG